jgi:hypothetical protein
MSYDLQLSDSLKAVAEAAKEGDVELNAARAALKASEEQVDARIAALVGNVATVVFASNSQVVHQKAIRNLYWGARIKASVIAQAFGINEHSVHSTAGPLIEETPCEGGCGHIVERIYRSHSDWKDQGRNSKRRTSHLCTDCKARREALGRIEYEKAEARRQAEAAEYCAQNGHHWGADDIGGRRAENGVDWISDNRPVRLENANLVSIDTNGIVLQLFCMNWCGATMQKRISATPD